MMKTSLRIFLIFLMANVAVAFTTGHDTFNGLSSYEKLNYDPSMLLNQHTRMMQANGRGREVTLNLQAYNRTFISHLSHGKAVFSNRVKFKVDGKETTEYEPRTFYSGQLEGEPGKSRVAGHIVGGVFDGTITTQQGTFHVERAHKFFPDAQDFHSIIYHEKDVIETGSTPSGRVKGQLLEELKKKAAPAVPLSKHKIQDHHSRLKRAIFNNRFCPIRVATDHLYLENVGRGNVVNTMSDIVSVIDSVQAIFGDTDFDNDGIRNGIQPVIVTLEILSYEFSLEAENLTITELLELWSREDQSEFCLSLLLTYRDFPGGVKGLSWVGQPRGGRRGGICEQRLQIPSGPISLNTAVVSALNFGVLQPRAVFTLDIAHELGHGFGAEDDPDNCSPEGSQGNYIMFPQATDGTLPNNRRFSSCSIDSIRPVLETKSDCFTATEAFCGNGIVEEDEECDCGSNCDMDMCCHGYNCTLTEGSVCSLSEPCCTVSGVDPTRCQFRSSDVECLAESECGLPSICTGRSSECPTPQSRDNTILCNNGRNICVDGVCSGSVCVRENFDDCQCSPGTDEDNSKLCHVCCRPRGGGECTSSFTLFGNDNGQFREGGRSCNNFQGYCSSATPPVCVTVGNNKNDLEGLLNKFFPSATTSLGTTNKASLLQSSIMAAIVTILLFVSHLS